MNPELQAKWDALKRGETVTLDRDDRDAMSFHFFNNHGEDSDLFFFHARYTKIIKKVNFVEGDTFVYAVTMDRAQYTQDQLRWDHKCKEHQKLASKCGCLTHWLRKHSYNEGLMPTSCGDGECPVCPWAKHEGWFLVEPGH